MRLDHLIQAYNFHRIPAKIDEEINIENERAGVIHFYNGITASYLLDNEQMVIAMKIFFNCITTEEKNASNQINHTINILNVINKTVMNLSNVSKKETNLILKKLGLFNATFKEGKQIKNMNMLYKIEVFEGLLSFSVQKLAEKFL